MKVFIANRYGIHYIHVSTEIALCNAMISTKPVQIR